MKRRAAFAGIVATLVACAGTAPRPALEPRWVAVHNALAALGMVQAGPIQQGSLGPGGEARLALDLPAQCATVVALGSAGVRDLDLGLLDADDHPVARDTTHDAQPAVRICPEKAGRFTLVVRMASGSGEFVAATWTGAPTSSWGGERGATREARDPALAGASPAPRAGEAGTCDAPIPLGPGSTSGNTRRGESEHVAGCGSSDARESVYRLDVARRQRVTIDVDPSFDSVVYVRKDDCADKDAEIACNDDVPSAKSGSSRGSRIDEVLDPGTYFVFVDGYNNEAGAFRMDVQARDVPSLADACSSVRPVVGKATGSITTEFDHGHGSCDLGRGPDGLHRLDVPQRARARVLMRSDDFSPVVHVRRTCADDRSELGCTDAGAKPEEATFVGFLDPGAYTVFADSTEKGARGNYTLSVDLATEAGSGVRGDACGDALPIAPNEKPIEGDTFEAKDDLSPRCAAPGAPDAFYRFEITRRSRVTARFTAQEGEHVFVLARSCTDRATEIACTSTVDEILPPGTYSLAVDGAAKGPFGRYTFQLKAKDISGQEGACRAAPPLPIGRAVTGTTAGAGDRFVASCAGKEDLQASGDRVYQLTLAARTHLLLTLSTPTFDGVLAIRKSCVDLPGARSARAAEVACNNDGPDNRHSKLDLTLDAGTYWVVVDGHQGKNEGPFTLEAKVLR